MQYLDKYKAATITFLLTGIVVFTLFSVHITQKAEEIAETFYEIEPKTEEEILQELEDLKQLEDLKSPTTNKAFNEDEEFKNLMKNFKTVDANDFEKTAKQLEENKAESDDKSELENTEDSDFNSDKSYALKQKETKAYDKLKNLLDKKKNGIAEHATGGSTLSYSLKGRHLLSYNTPRYLCQTSGKIVVNIKVNNNGNVIEAYINGATNSSNQCLKEHAIEYAKAVKFNNASRSEQLGSITFYFKGK